MTAPHPGRLRRLLLRITTAQWSAIECANDVWMAAENGVSAALADYPPSRRPAYRPLLAAAAWQQAHPHDSRLAAVTQGEPTIYMTLGDDLAAWNERGDGLWLPGIPGELPVEADSHGPFPLVLGESKPFLTSSGLLWAGFDTPALRRHRGALVEVRLWEVAPATFGLTELPTA